MKIYVLTNPFTVHGHGESATGLGLASKSGWEFRPYPAFKTVQDAEKYLDETQKEHKYFIRPKITELDLLEQY